MPHGPSLHTPSLLSSESAAARPDSHSFPTRRSSDLVSSAGQLRHMLVRRTSSCTWCCCARCGLRGLGLMSDVSGLLGIHGDVSCSFVVESGWGSQRPTVEGWGCIKVVGQS